MSVEIREVGREDGEVRLDRWFHRHFPALGHGHLQKLLRTGQVRVDGRRAKHNQRLLPGQKIRVPPLPTEAPPPPQPSRLRDEDARLIKSLVLHEDERLIVLNKPAGLAVQGGTGTTRHVDAMLEALTGPGGRPRLVHRLDRDTSGLLVVARDAAAAASLGSAFKRHKVRKLYWAIVVGRPPAAEGTIDRALGKQGGEGAERMTGDDDGKPARTRYRVVARAGKIAAWMALMPETGRTHQLRAHCTGLGNPILGDGKYGGKAAKLTGAPAGLMLHARALSLPHPDGGHLTLTAAVPPHMKEAFGWLGLPREDLPGSRLEDWS